MSALVQYVRGQDFISLTEVTEAEKPYVLFGMFMRYQERALKKYLNKIDRNRQKNNYKKCEICNTDKTHISKHGVKVWKTRDGKTVCDPCFMKGRKHMEDFKDYQRRLKTGRNNPMWRGGKWKESLSHLKEHLRKLAIYKTWRKAVYERDNYTCQKCGSRGKYIEAHHIKNFVDICIENNITTLEDALSCKLLWDINNGQTLCSDCHDIITFHEMKKRHAEWY